MKPWLAIVFLAALGLSFGLTFGINWGGDDEESSSLTNGTAESGSQTNDEAASSNADELDNDIGSSFTPEERYSQSCAPEDGSCTWDIGVRGSYTTYGREAVQVGVVKGVSISWLKGDKKADPSPNGRCALVILTPNSWFENLTIKDANVTVYDVWPGDVAGWIKTLAVQNAYEQEVDYGCPTKEFEDIPQWGSPIASPPCGTPGFANCEQTSSQASQEQSTATTSNSGSDRCPTVNCKIRRTSADAGGSVTFSTGEAVNGFKISIGGKNYSNCHFESAPGGGKVVDGVVNYWPEEVQSPRCN